MHQELKEEEEEVVKNKKRRKEGRGDKEIRKERIHYGSRE